MRRIVVVLTGFALTAGALYLSFALLAGTTTGACPTALLEGVLIEQDGSLAVQSVPEGGVATVQWPFGYGIGEENGTLTLTRVFMTVAREGDLVSMAGGVPADDSVFVACGPISLSAVRGDPAPLTLGDGLPQWIAPGTYELVFEVEASSDAATPAPSWWASPSTARPARSSPAPERRRPATPASVRLSWWPTGLLAREPCECPTNAGSAPSTAARSRPAAS